MKVESLFEEINELMSDISNPNSYLDERFRMVKISQE